MSVGLAIIIFRPDVAAQNIDRLRDILGDAPVAQLEAAALSIQDQARQSEYQVCLIKPGPPWSASDSATCNKRPSPTPIRADPSAHLASNQDDHAVRKA